MIRSSLFENNFPIPPRSVRPPPTIFNCWCWLVRIVFIFSTHNNSCEVLTLAFFSQIPTPTPPALCLPSLAVRRYVQHCESDWLGKFLEKHSPPGFIRFPPTHTHVGRWKIASSISQQIEPQLWGSSVEVRGKRIRGITRGKKSVSWFMMVFGRSSATQSWAFQTECVEWSCDYMTTCDMRTGRSFEDCQVVFLFLKTFQTN